MQALEKTAHEWLHLPAGEVGDAIVAALAAAGVEYLFFTSGSELAFYQEAIAKAEALGTPAPRLITMIHEHASLNAALGYAALMPMQARSITVVPCIRRRTPTSRSLSPAAAARPPTRGRFAVRATAVVISGFSNPPIKTASYATT
jgi:hypothetical protein